MTIAFLVSRISKKGNFDGLCNQPIFFYKNKNGECLYKHHMTCQKGNFDGLYKQVM